MDRRSLGAIGEEAAAEFLERKGWRILERNWKIPWGEIDLIGENEDGLLVFLEVKAEKLRPGFLPEQHVDSRKQGRLRRLVLRYLWGHPKFQFRPFRLDVIALDLAPTGEILTLRHHEGVVRA